MTYLLLSVRNRCQKLTSCRWTAWPLRSSFKYKANNCVL